MGSLEFWTIFCVPFLGYKPQCRIKDGWINDYLTYVAHFPLEFALLTVFCTIVTVFNQTQGLVFTAFRQRKQYV